ncbi:uncharacterized protein G2W53_011936 [Senna tora]|uniref:Uncharacterized protein n=1 Tax=Senna tora TaxID=362788 RepID=A0A834TW19_9FABA|nr:uncharacterized protein G2W53_011936 [Senna tora]
MVALMKIVQHCEMRTLASCYGQGQYPHYVYNLRRDQRVEWGK